MENIFAYYIWQGTRIAVRRKLTVSEKYLLKYIYEDAK